MRIDHGRLERKPREFTGHEKCRCPGLECDAGCGRKTHSCRANASAHSPLSALTLARRSLPHRSNYEHAFSAVYIEAYIVVLHRTPPSSIAVLLATTPWSAVGPYRSDARDAPAPSWAGQLKSPSLTTTRSRATGTAAGARGGARVFRVGGGAGAFHAPALGRTLHSRWNPDRGVGIRFLSRVTQQ
jgi:hypothetical protein